MGGFNLRLGHQSPSAASDAPLTYQYRTMFTLLTIIKPVNMRTVSLQQASKQAVFSKKSWLDQI